MTKIVKKPYEPINLWHLVRHIWVLIKMRELKDAGIISEKAFQAQRQAYFAFLRGEKP